MRLVAATGQLSGSVMHRPPGQPELTPAEVKQVRNLVDRFEAAWNGGGPGVLGEFLPTAGDRLYAPARTALIKSDLELRWRNKKPVFLEDYLERFPDLRADPLVLTHLLFEEYAARKRHGDQPALPDYRGRFPDQYASFERLTRGPDYPTDMLPPPPKVIQSAPEPRSEGSLVPVLGGYKLIKRIGSGSYGEVWQAEAPGGVEAAVKIIMRPLQHSEAKRELDSLELMKRLRHPFLLQTQAFWRLEDRLLIAMELADGSIRDRLRDCADAGLGGIPVQELLVYTREASEALDFLHSKKVLHRDIKPDNILLLGRHVKVADFGLARVLQAQRAKMTVSGTPAFMPPESWTGKTTEQSDQYSLAGSYVELRLNRHLFPCEDMASAMLDHLQKTPELDPLPKPEQQVLLKALAKDPTKRFTTCMEFWEALQQAVSPASRKASPPPSAVPPKKRAAHDAGTVNFGQLETDDRPLAATLPAGTEPTQPQAAGHRRKLIAGALTAALVASAVVLGLVLWPRSGGDTPDTSPEETVKLPDGFQKADDAKVVTIGDQRWYDRIAHALSDKTELVMLLIPKSRPTDPEPFYMLRDKVTNHAFGQYARDNPEAVQYSKWEGGPEGPNAIPLGVRDFPFHPVLRVTLDEADGYAHSLGGQVPTAAQWDKAAGRFDGAVGPFAGDGQGLTNEELGVGLDKLLPANRARCATTLFGCRDMAGNGYEWTRSVHADERKSVPLDDPFWNDRVSLRGQTYFAPNTYRFADRPNSRYRLKNPQNDEPGASAEVGFRIVLELPQS